MIGRAAAMLATVAMLSLVAGAAHAKRLAFVVGVNLYDGLKPDQQLRKAVNDAHAVADALKQVGFEVFYAENTRRTDFLRMWQHFLNAVGKGDTAAFYFAGHGFEIRGNAFLLLRDVPDVSEGEEVIKESSLQVSALLERLSEQQPQVSLFIIDACRNDPTKQLSMRGIGLSRGFTRVEPPSGTLVMLSASAGQEALDALSETDTNRNSVYTRTLLPLLTQPGLEMTALAKQVRSKVETLAQQVHHSQRPAYYDGLSGDFYLVEPHPDAAASRPATTLASLPNEAADAWAAVKDSTNTVLLDAYATRFSDSFYSSIARARIDELKHAGAASLPAPRGDPDADLDVVWAATRNTRSAAVLRAFIRLHGDSVFAADARARLARLTQPQTAALTPTAPMPAATSARRSEPLGSAAEAQLKPGDVFRECPGCPEMVVVPPGSFAMGSPPDEPGRQPDEGPQHSVAFARSFAVGRFAVSVDEWSQCVERGGCPPLPPGGAGRASNPVVEVSFDEALAYVGWLSTTTGKSYRLLSEAEREYVARAGSTTPFWWGSTITTRQANYDAAASFDGSPEGGSHAGGSLAGGSLAGGSRGRPLPVGFFQANPWGLFQVHGNVSEWVADCLHADYANAPTDGSAWREPACERHVVRGGSWNDGAARLRAASRLGFVPTFRDSSIGLRVARSLADHE